MSQTGWTPVAEDTSAWTPVEEAPSAKPEPSFSSKIAAAAEKSHFGAGEFADPDHPAHTLLKLAMHDIENGEYSKGANGLLGAAAEFLKPTLPLTVAAAPISSALAFAGSGLASKGMQIGARSLGATPEQATLAGNVAGIAGGAGIGKLSSLAADTGLANRMYRSALKVPPASMPDAQVQKLVGTGLREGIPVSPGGAEKLGNLIDDLNSKIAGKIQEGAGKGVTVNPQAVASRLGDVESRFATQVNPSADLKAIETSRQEFLGAFGAPSDFKVSAQKAVDAAPHTQQLSQAIKPREGYVYRAITGPEYDNAIRSGVLNPGKAADTGGTVNFSKEPISLYSAMASKGRSGMIVEVPESALKEPRFFEGSKDLYAESQPGIPLSKISKAWGMQLESGKGWQVADLSNDVKKLGGIPADQAQALKQGTYQQLKSKAYGELKSADIESQKALARGIKEELASQIPEIGDLNARESQLIGLDKALDRAVNRISNHQLFGIGTPIAAGGIKAMTGSTKLAAAIGMLRGVIDDPIVKSKLAIAMSRRGVPGAAINSRLAAYSSALEGAATAAPPAGQPSPQGNEQ